MPSLDDIALRMPRERIVNAIRQGVGPMPGYPKLTKDEQLGLYKDMKATDAKELGIDPQRIAEANANARAAGVAVSGLAVRDPKRGLWRPFATVTRADGTVATVTAIGVDAVRQRVFIGGDFSAVAADCVKVVIRPPNHR